MTDAPARPVTPHHRRRPAGARRLLLAAVLGALLIALVAGVSPAWDHTDAAPAAPRTSRALPFDLPAADTLRRSQHLVFAHYFTPYPLSLDNQPPDRDYYSRNYLRPDGEGGKHAAYGGLLRDRPAPRAPRRGNWRLADLEQEVRTARDAGLDGFTVDLLSLSGPNWQRVKLLLTAAHRVDPAFRIQLMPDMTALGADPATLARALATLAAEPAAHRLGDGRLVVTPFKAEAHDPTWWRRVINSLAGQGIRTALVPLFLDLRGHAREFAPLSYGFSKWGNRSWTGQSGIPGDIRLAHGLGKKWMQPVSVQDARPNQGVYDEAGNTATLRASWGHAIDDGADWVQLTTWNDYSEGSHFAPSLHNGASYLDLSSYYLTRFKTGHWPRIVRDTVYITARVQFAAAGTPQQRTMRPRHGTPKPRDTVEALTFLTAPADLATAVDRDRRTTRVPAGVHATLFPLRPGHTTAAIRRHARTTTRVTTLYPVRPDPQTQDLQYYAVSSRRDG
ncbi:glycoside hydrolase family 71 protein [Streptomyces sp. NPDC058045]|uniref:glycoside hydrolase family 71 protein n=1 Tax=Streptomyces sp. NPDC058045 TaxID=3346311 RepID=UPI0036DFDF55